MFARPSGTAMLLEKMQALVLASSDYGESDRIVSLFTLEQGRLKGFARGARNSRKRFGPALESFARIELQLIRKDGLASLRSADVITLYSSIRGSLNGIAHALYACELVDVFTPEGHPLPRLYRLLVAYLDHLHTGRGTDSDRRFFEINLLNILGYRPSLDSCCRCDTSLTEEGALMQQGGELVCRRCSANGSGITPKVLKELRSCLETGRFGVVPFDGESLRQAGILLDEALLAHIGRRPKSLDFLQQAEDSAVQ